MRSISKIVKKIIVTSPFLEEALTEKLINVSSLARKIRQEVEDAMGEPIKEGAIVMAINRLEPSYYYKINIGIKDFVNNIGDIIVRSSLRAYTYENSNTLIGSQKSLLDEASKNKKHFHTISQGIYETTIIISTSLKETIEEEFIEEHLIAAKGDLSSITVKLPLKNTEVSGLYYYIFKKLAWTGINIVEIISTTNEFTLVVSDDDIDKAFSILIGLKKD